MRWLPSVWYYPTPKAMRSSGVALLHIGFGFTLLLTLLILRFSNPLSALILPTLFLGGLAFLYLFRRPLINLAVVLGLFVLVSDYEEGIQLIEVFYGLYYLSFLSHWLITRTIIFKDSIFSQPEDKAFLILLSIITLSIPLTFLFGGEPRGLLSEWTSLMLLGFYFPIKEACIRYKNGIKVVIGVLLWIGFFAAIRNIILYRQSLLDAELAYQIARGRVHFNDNVLMATSIVSLGLLVYRKKIRELIPSTVFFILLLSGLIFTLSRAFWMAFLFGAALMFLAADAQYKRRLLMLTTVGITCFLCVLLLFLNDYVDLIFLGLADRFLSIPTAITNDTSMINRFYESKAVLSQIMKNPVLGYGMGVPYIFYDIAHVGTDQDAFVHNAYIGLWYKFGILGLGSVLYIWGKIVWRGVRALRIRAIPFTKIVTFSSAMALTAFAVGAMTSNPFFLMDGTLLFGMLTGLVSGGYRRSLLEAKAQLS